MNRRHALRALAGLALCPLCAPRTFAADAHWSYEGATGPEKWGDLDAANKACAIGTQQSPLDIGATVRAQLAPIQFSWRRPADTIINNGDSIRVDFAEGASITVGKDKYDLQQFHFHHPSEHRIAGKSFPMEVHFVHKAASGALGVVGVLMATGSTNVTFKKVVQSMPDKEGPAVKPKSVIDPNGLLPAKRTYYSYAGSLTTPPCSETVSWMLLTEPIQVAQSDVAAFARLYPMNARPVQKDFRRFVLRSG